MSNVLSEQKRQQVLALGRLGWPVRRIEEATGVRRETASKYLKAAGIMMRPPRGRRTPKPASEVITDPADSAKPASEVITDLVEVSWPPKPSRAPAASACELHRERIEQWLDKGRNAMAIWQDLVTDHGFEAGYASVMRFVRKLRGKRGGDAHPVIETEPGEEAQVDYGDGPMVRHPDTGKYRRTRLFVLTLGYSRKAVRLLVFKSSTETWAKLHEEAFRRLGGAARVVVLDNLKEGVIKPDIYDPQVNPLYRDVLAHYGAVALPCRVRHANRKGKVERAIGHTKGTALRGLRFESLEAARAHLDRWSDRWADTRIHGTTKRQVSQMFAEEQPHLLPLPIEPFRYYRFGTRTVHMDGTVEIDGAYYGAPPGRLGHELHVRWNDCVVRLLEPVTEELLREYRPLRRGRYRIRPEDKPKRTPPQVDKLLFRAEQVGEHVGVLSHTIYERDGQLGVKRILGVLSLAKKYGVDRTDKACAVALEFGATSYRFVRRYLEHQPEMQLTLRQVDPLIRQLTQYRDLIEQITDKETPL